MIRGIITAPGNDRIKNVIAVRDKAKVREGQRVFLAEGIKMLYEVPKERIREIYVGETAIEKKAVKSLIGSYKYHVVSDTVFERMSSTATPQGILALVEMFDYTLEQILDKDNGLWIILEDIRDPGNLGTIMRTAEAAGVDGIIMNSNTVDIYNPKTARSTMGSIYRVPFIYVKDLSEILKRMRKRAINIYAAHLEGTKFLDDFSYVGKTAFLIGNESNGLSEELTGIANKLVKIPMHGKVESLNAAVAASILMYEAVRQRREI